jgi:hypothetical protein
MTKPAVFRWILIVALALIFDGFVGASPKAVSVPTQSLGKLEITVSKLEQGTMIADRFDGGPAVSSYPVGRIYLHFKNVGDFPVCASLVPSVEEYKGSEWMYTQPIKIGFAYNPKIENLMPGAEKWGYYDFGPSPQKRGYVLVLQQFAQSQKCGETRKNKNAITSDAPSVRFSLSGST